VPTKYAAVSTRFATALASFAFILSACGSAGTPPVSTPAPFVPNGRIDATQLLQLQASGRLFTPLSHERVVQMLRAASKPRPRIVVPHASNAVVLWTTLTQDSDLLGQSKKLSKTVAVVDTQANGCVYPITVKVDAGQNVWAGCEYDNNDENGVYQEYTKSGTLAATYTDGCPAPVSSCGEFYSYSSDGASNANYVFDALAYYYAGLDCNPDCTYSFGSGFEYWPAGGSSSTPTLISLPYGNPVYGVAFMDLDSSGDIWFDYYGCTSGSNCGYGIGEITAPTTSKAAFVSVESPGFLQCGGGVYASAKSTTINVIDSCSRLVYQFTTTGSQTGKLGPIGRLGDPISGGFSADDSKIAVGDDKGWLDVGNLKSNKWTVVQNVYFRDGLMGAAYAISDKTRK
jgi:hypothetical protein